MKFLVLWHFETTRLTPELTSAVMKQPDYAKMLLSQGKLECRYHVIGSHGGAWIYKVDSNEELDRLLAMFSRVQLRDLQCAASGGNGGSSDRDRQTELSRASIRTDLSWAEPAGPFASNLAGGAGRGSTKEPVTRARDRLVSPALSAVFTNQLWVLLFGCPNPQMVLLVVLNSQHLP